MSAGEEKPKLTPEQQLSVEGVGPGVLGVGGGKLMPESEVFEALGKIIQEQFPETTGAESSEPGIGGLYSKAQELYGQVLNDLNEFSKTHGDLAMHSDIQTRDLFGQLAGEMQRYTSLREIDSQTTDARDQLLGYMRAIIMSLEQVAKRVAPEKE